MRVNHAARHVRESLDLKETVEVTATFHESGELHHACGMDMLHGTLAVQ